MLMTVPPCLSLLKHLIKVQGGCHQMTVLSPTAQVRKPAGWTSSSTSAAAAGVQVPAAVGEIVILLDHPRPLLGVSIGLQKGRQQNDSLADG